MFYGLRGKISNAICRLQWKVTGGPCQRVWAHLNSLTWVLWRGQRLSCSFCCLPHRFRTCRTSCWNPICLHTRLWCTFLGHKPRRNLGSRVYHPPPVEGRADRISHFYYIFQRCHRGFVESAFQIWPLFKYQSLAKFYITCQHFGFFMTWFPFVCVYRYVASIPDVSKKY